MITLPSTSISQPIIFDGTDADLPFVRFIQQLVNSPGWIYPTTPSAIDGFEYIVPSYFYGDALRYYETLDPACQDNWYQLRKVMAERFPRTRQEEESDNGIWTLARAPPITSSMLARLERTSLGGEHPGSTGSEGEKHERSNFSLFTFKEKLRTLLSTPSYGPVSRPPESLITVHSMFIRHSGKQDMWARPYTVIHAAVDLSDRRSVAACKERPLFRVHSPMYRIEQYEVGFTFTVHYGTWDIYFRHKVLAPKKSKLDHVQSVGTCSVSPNRQWSFARPITEFVLDPPTSFHIMDPPRRFTIKSCIRLKGWEPYSNVEMEIGDIKWFFNIS